MRDFWDRPIALVDLKKTEVSEVRTASVIMAMYSPT
jgi:hypothetical protein